MQNLEIVKIRSPLPKIVRINGVDYRWRQLPEIEDEQVHNLGGGVEIRFLLQTKTLIIYNEMTSDVQVVF